MTAVPFALQPLNVGAEVIGLDLGSPISALTRDALYDAWLRYGVLVFRNGVVTNQQHLALSRCFGELELHPIPEIRVEGEPYLIELGGTRRGPAYVFDEKDLVVGRLPWHRDTGFTVECCKGAILRMTEPAAEMGETMLADTAAAYDALPKAMKQRLDGLQYRATLRLGPFEQTRPGAFWKSVRKPTEQEYIEHSSSPYSMEIKKRYPSVLLPAVITHPESGRKCIFISPTYVDQFLGMSQQDSDALHAELADHMTQPSFCYTHRWRQDDMVLWDNRRFLHAAQGYPAHCTRTGLRTTLAGSLKVGRYADVAPDLDGLAPILD